MPVSPKETLVLLEIAAESQQLLKLAVLLIFELFTVLCYRVGTKYNPLVDTVTVNIIPCLHPENLIQ